MKIDPTTNEVVGTFEVGMRPEYLAVDDGLGTAQSQSEADSEGEPDPAETAPAIELRVFTLTDEPVVNPNRTSHRSRAGFGARLNEATLVPLSETDAGGSTGQTAT